MSRSVPLLAALLSMLSAASVPAQNAQRWSNGLPADPGYFPLAVWLQSPANAERYKAVGVNLYIGLWEGPTQKQLDALAKAGMPVICDQNDFALQHLDSKTIVGWMHGDEPDNAQAKPKGQQGWDPPIKPEKIVADYQAIRKKDPTRPVMLNLGMGVAWDGWFGRGARTNHPDDYPEYVQGCDIVSFDIYPVVADAGAKYDAIRGKLELVPFGVGRLLEWTKQEKPVWTCIETTRISNPAAKLTPEQVRSEVWMAIIRGSRGIVYFCHEFQPKFVEAGFLANPAMADGIKAINAEVTRLAPVINSPDVKEAAVAEGGKTLVMTRRYQNATYVFAASLSDQPATVTLRLPNGRGSAVEVIGEDRTLDAKAGGWRDEFKGYAVHLYRLAE